MSVAQKQFEIDLMTGFSAVEETILRINSSEPTSSFDKESRKEYRQIFTKYCKDNNIKLS